MLESKVEQLQKSWKHYREKGRHTIANIFLNDSVAKQMIIDDLKWVLKK